jgi:hypothetical protein
MSIKGMPPTKAKNKQRGTKDCVKGVYEEIEYNKIEA